MTEAIDPTAPESAPTPTHNELAAAAWEKAHAADMAGSEKQEPITKDDVRGEKEPEKTTPDRVLVAPKMKELLDADKAPAPNPLEERLARIEAALAPKQEPAQLGLEDEVRELKAMLLEKEEAAAQAAISAQKEEQWNLLREGVISNLRADAERFPFLVGLNQEDNVYKTLRSALEAGKDVSEDDIASQAEAKLRAAYEKMQSVAGGNTATSEDPKQSETPSTPNTTLTPDLSAADNPTDVESVLEAKGGDRKAAAAELWSNLDLD